jgi:hypothetical protein
VCKLGKKRYLVGPHKKSGTCRAHIGKLQHEPTPAKELSGEEEAIFCGEEGEALREDEGEEHYAADGGNGDEATIRPGTLLAARHQSKDVGEIDGRTELQKVTSHASS